jgi:hypothetical protein
VEEETSILCADVWVGPAHAHQLPWTHSHQFCHLSRHQLRFHLYLCGKYDINDGSSTRLQKLFGFRDMTLDPLQHSLGTTYNQHPKCSFIHPEHKRETEPTKGETGQTTQYIFTEHWTIHEVYLDQHFNPASTYYDPYGGNKQPASIVFIHLLNHQKVKHNKQHNTYSACTEFQVGQDFNPGLDMIDPHTDHFLPWMKTNQRSLSVFII